MGRIINYSSFMNNFNVKCDDIVLGIINFFVMAVKVVMQDQRNINFNFKIESINFDDNGEFEHVVLRNIERDGVSLYDDYLFGTQLTRVTDLYIYRRNDNGYEMWLNSQILNEVLKSKGAKECDYNYYYIAYNDEDCSILFNKIIELLNDKIIDVDEFEAKANDLFGELADMISLPKNIINAQSLLFNLINVGLRPEENIVASPADSEE